MSTLYFNTNASTGAGSLAETIRNASPGDVVRPDEALFERGQTIVVRLAEPLTLDKNVTLDGGPFRVRLDGGGSFRCVQSLKGVNASFTSFDFIGGVARNGGGLYLENRARVELNRCVICGCDATQNGGGLYVADGATLVLADSAVFANRAQNAGGGAYLAATSRFTSTGSTLAANADATLNGAGDFSDVVAAPGFNAAASVPRNSIICVATSGGSALYNASQAALNGSVVDVSVGEVGFVAPGALASPYAAWTPNVWQNVNLRLLDDAAPAPSPRRDSGNIEFQTTYDLDGNFRGRTLDAGASCSPGAYETIQADLFWVGVDAVGAQVQDPSLLATDGWATSRFATVGSGAAPESGLTLFLDGAVAFVGGSLKPARFIVGGYANLSFATTASKTITSVFEIGVGATTCQTNRTQMFSASESAASRFGDWCYVRNSFWLNNADDAQIAKNARFSLFTSFAKLYPSGIYDSYTLQRFDVATIAGDSGDDREINVFRISPRTATSKLRTLDAARVVCRSFEWQATYTGAASSSYLASGAAPLIVAPREAVQTSPDAPVNDFEIDVSNGAELALTLNGQKIYGASDVCAATLAGNAKIDRRGLRVASLTLNDNASLLFEEATLNIGKLKTLNGSRLVGSGLLDFTSNGGWTNDGGTLNDVAPSKYDAASNEIKIAYDFDPFDLRGALVDGAYRWTSGALDSGAVDFVFAKHAFVQKDKSDYLTIYDSSQPVSDATAHVYETVAEWNGVPLKTIVHAAPEAGWNFYRVEASPYANLGGVKIYHGKKTTRYFVCWNADYAPEPTYYYQGGANGSYASTSDWALTADGVAKFEGAPTSADAVFVVPRSVRLRDFPDDSRQTSVVFPSTVDVYDARNRRLSDAEARLVSVGVPTPSAPEFYVGNGGTSGFWPQCDGATLYRVEAVDGSATGLTTSNRWLDANELQTKTWRVRVAAPIYGGVEKWSTQTTAVQPFSALVEKANYDDATAGNAFELLYSDDFDGVRDATVERTRKSDGTSTILAQNFAGGEFVDVPETFDEYVYRVSWTPSPENVWFETTAAPWFVADGFDAKTQTNFITTPSRAYETPTFAARIEKKSTGELLKRQDVAKISYSLFETRDLWKARAERLAVGPDGSYWRHDVEIPAATVRDSLLVDPNFWSLDEIGANFVFSPEDGRPFFPGPGTYLVRATLETTNKRRIVVEFPAQVE